MFVRPFETENKQAENKNRAAGIVTTIVVHALLLLLLFFLYISPPDPPFSDNAGGTSVNFGSTDEGMGDQQQYTAVPVKVEDVKENAPTPPPVAAKSEEELETQEKEEAAIVESKKVVKKEKVKPVAEAVYKPNPKPTRTTEPTPPKPKVNNDALFTPGAQGTPNKSTGDGTGHRKGDQGKANGDPNSANYTGSGDGPGSGSGPGHGDGPGGHGPTAGPGPGNVRLTGRSLKSRPAVKNPCENIKGKVVIEIKVNRNGHVTDAKFTQAGSNTADDCLINIARQAAMKYTFDENSTAAETQTGSITFIFKED
ncbi:MAG: energy transducer TonB [Bacteroidetes bacterium]|nr:energy transducer TonB [Bacteroidota bacterium]